MNEALITEVLQVLQSADDCLAENSHHLRHIGRLPMAGTSETRDQISNLLTLLERKLKKLEALNGE